MSYKASKYITIKKKASVIQLHLECSWQGGVKIDDRQVNDIAIVKKPQLMAKYGWEKL